MIITHNTVSMGETMLSERPSVKICTLSERYHDDIMKARRDAAPIYIVSYDSIVQYNTPSSPVPSYF